MTVFLHAGSSKAGSTAIQQALRLNKKEISERGYSLASFTSSSGREIDSNMAFFIAFANDEKISQNIARVSQLGIDVKTDRKVFREQIRSFSSIPGRGCILSAECIDTFHEESLRALADTVSDEGGDVAVIYYLRPPYSLLCSAIPFLINRGKPLVSPSTFLGTCARSPAVNRMKSSFRDIEFYSYKMVSDEENKVPGHFFRRIFEDDVFKFEGRRFNAGISNAATRLLGSLNAVKSKAAGSEGLDLSALDQDCEKIKHIKGVKFRLTRDEFVEVEDFLKKENQALEASLGDGFSDTGYPLLTGNSVFSADEMDDIRHIWGELTPHTRAHLASEFAFSF
ncbi:hypothetical protein [Salipiger mangrovisoli]|uniref:Uncharacterized protein n=1 Tax=Salipiger mangrovisoli TaxID=2865933 RepID=A0ABR9X9D7_9RHOB|nr:hypothetical protein [Salipiger mangrovisoli]MBE9640225.1 hypothetical protein [Salipiger mangrovisoli]